MMSIRRKALQRRSFLRGMGTLIALPALDAMTPAFAGAGRSQTDSPSRLAIVYVPNGIHMPDWEPAAQGMLGELPPTLQPLQAFRDQMLVLSGLAQVEAYAAPGERGGDHPRASANYLTGVRPRKTDGADILVAASVDQIAARHAGANTRFASLELGTEDGRDVGNCASGYSCAYLNSISWRSESAPMPPEINPRSVFERMFGSRQAGQTPEERESQRRHNESILNFVREDARSLLGELGAADRLKMDEYLTALREIERRIQSTEREDTEIPLELEKPDGIPAEFHEHVGLMLDLMAIAFQSDLTRVSTLMFGRELSIRTYPELGITDAHHPLTHHGGDQAMIDKVRKINRFHIEQFERFVARLASTPEGDGTMLDHTMILYGSALSDGNIHLHEDLPVLLVGGSRHSLRGGRHIKFPDRTPLTNLFLSLLERMGVPEETMGDSSGRLAGLAEG